MHDRRVARVRARAAFHRSEAARLDAEADAVEAARATGVSQWGSPLYPSSPADVSIPANTVGSTLMDTAR